MMNSNDNWYTTIKSKIETYPLATNATKRENVASVANVARVETKKSLFVDGEGHSLKCAKCKFARTRYIPENLRNTEQGRSGIWHGLCLLDREGILQIEGTHTLCGLNAVEGYPSAVQRVTL